MNDDIKQDRSPRCPRHSLEDSITLASKLHGQIGKASVNRETVAKAIGFGGLNGAAQGAIGSLTQYGLINKNGQNIGVSPLAIRILHPMNDAQKQTSIQEAAVFCNVFRELFEKMNDCSEQVIASHLVQNGFTPDGAKRTASVYAANKELAKLESHAILNENSSENESHLETNKIVNAEVKMAGSSTFTAKPTVLAAKTEKTVLAQYSIPIGASEATITFTGEKLTVEDFDALADYVAIFKKQFERKQKTEPSSPAWPKPPFAAMWKNKDFDKMVKIVDFMGEKDGKMFYKSEDGTGIAATELFPGLGQ